MSEFKLIKCGKMYDGKSDTLQENMEILVNGTMIEEVGKKTNLSTKHRDY